MLLAIDTSAGTSVAVVDGRRIVAQRDEPDTRRHAEAIGTLIAGVLDEAGIAPSAITGVAVGMGPGPFTGLRVGIVAARAFAAGVAASVLPVASHDAVALAEGRPLLVITDARRREVAWSAYAEPDAEGAPVRRHGPVLARRDELDAAVAAAGLESLERLEVATIPAGPLGMLAGLLADAGREPGPAEPLYLRSPDVTLSTPKRVTG